MQCCMHAAMMQEQVSYHMATAEAAHALRRHMWEQLLLQRCYGRQSARRQHNRMRRRQHLHLQLGNLGELLGCSIQTQLNGEVYM